RLDADAREQARQRLVLRPPGVVGSAVERARGGRDPEPHRRGSAGVLLVLRQFIRFELSRARTFLLRFVHAEVLTTCAAAARRGSIPRRAPASRADLLSEVNMRLVRIEA